MVVVVVGGSLESEELEDGDPSASIRKRFSLWTLFIYFIYIF